MRISSANAVVTTINADMFKGNDYLHWDVLYLSSIPKALAKQDVCMHDGFPGKHADAL